MLRLMGNDRPARPFLCRITSARFTWGVIYAQTCPVCTTEGQARKERDVANFLTSALPLVQAEAGTLSWYAIEEGPGAYAIFDTFDTEEDRQAHLDGKVAAALMDKADELFSEPPQIHKFTLLAAK